MSDDVEFIKMVLKGDFDCEGIECDFCRFNKPYAIFDEVNKILSNGSYTCVWTIDEQGNEYPLRIKKRFFYD
jgi:hypothetical protein